MSTIDIINAKNQKVSKVELAAGVLEDKINKAVLHQGVRTHLASKHHGTVKTKDRGEVHRTGKKLFRQKGTGNARHGSRKSAPFVGGGRVFGPRPRNFTLGMPKKVRRLALREAIRSQLQEGNIIIIDTLPFKAIKTKDAVKFFKDLNLVKGLIVLDKASDVIEKSIRNVKGFKTSKLEALNLFDVLKYPKIVFTADAFKAVQEKYLTA